MRKKLLVIVVLGLALVSCSKNNTEKMIEICADQNFERMIGNTPLLTSKLKEKLLDASYYNYHTNCEARQLRRRFK